MEEDEFPKNIYDPYLFKKVGLGVDIAVVDVDLQINYKDLQELNEGVNESGIYIHLEPVGGFGGLGEVFTTPEFIETIPILLTDFTVNILAGFAYDAFIYAIKKLMKKIGQKKGNPKLLGYEIKQ